MSNTETMRLTAENVLDTLNKCLYKQEELKGGTVPENSVKVEGVITTYYFNPKRLNEQKENIVQMLSYLPETFKEGWSFLQLCIDKNNYQWTGMQSTMEALMVLGLAIGKFSYLMPRELWSLLPGSMPYIILVD